MYTAVSAAHHEGLPAAGCGCVVYKLCIETSRRRGWDLRPDWGLALISPSKLRFSGQHTHKGLPAFVIFTREAVGWWQAKVVFVLWSPRLLSLGWMTILTNADADYRGNQMRVGKMQHSVFTAQPS